MLSVAGPLQAGTSSAPVLQLDRNHLNWSFLTLKGGKGPISVSADIRLQAVPDASLQKVLLQPDEGGEPVAAGEAALLIDFHSSSMGKDLRTRLWFRPRDVAALQRGRIELTRGNERYKLYRYTGEGLFIVRRKPGPGEEGKAPGSWNNVKRSFSAYPGAFPDDVVLSDPAVLLYLASVADFQEVGDEVKILAYDNEDLLVVTMRYEGDEQVAADFKAEGPEGERAVQGRRSALRLGLTSRSLQGGGDGSGLKIAGLGGKLKILVDRELRVPLELRGKVGFAGNVALRIGNVRLTGRKD